MIALGCDPGAGRRTGWAVYDSVAGLTGCHTGSVGAVLDLLSDLRGTSVVLVLESETKARYYGEGGRSRARGVGVNEGIRQAIASYAETLGLRVVEVRARGKIPAEAWRAAWKWKGRLPSEHARDAAELARAWIAEQVGRGE